MPKMLLQMKAAVRDALVNSARFDASVDDVRFIVSPYRISPIGAHVDHQGGPVLGRTIDRYSVLAFVPSQDETTHLHALNDLESRTASFAPSAPIVASGWCRYAQAATVALDSAYGCKRGLVGAVHGSLLGAGLSSSASVILAYLHALAAVNDVQIDADGYVELARQVENDFLGLNNGIQDQTAISFGNATALLHMNVNYRRVTPIADPPNVGDVRFMLAYSGFSRELLGSGFNTRVAECREAAQALDSVATTLGEVAWQRRKPDALASLSPLLRRRAKHFYGEIERVEAGRQAWAGGDWDTFGRLMNQSCHSSIHYYESGSKPLADLHDMALQVEGIYGSRFSGGGYGGCLIMLVDAKRVAQVREEMLKRYLWIYPEKSGVADVFVVGFEDGVRIVK